MAAKATFDAANRLIILDQVAPVGGIVTIDIQIDLYSDAKEDWKTDSDLNKLRFLFDTEGGVDTITGEQSGDFYFLKNDAIGQWRIRPYEADHELRFVGNLFGTDVDLPIIVPTLGGYTVLAPFQRSSQALLKLSGSGVTEQDKIDIITGVWDRSAASHLTPGSFGAEIQKAHGNIIRLIESQRGHHTVTGNTYYWNPVNGDDAKDGLTPATAKLTWGGASGVDSLVMAHNHDLVLIDPGEAGGTTVITEQIIIDKEFTFIRGPGRDVVFRPTATTGETVSMESEGGELSGVRVETAATGDGEALVITGNFCTVHDVWVEASQGDGIRIQNVSYAKLKDIMVRNCAGNAVVFRGNVKDCKYNILSDAKIMENIGHGILFTGANCQQNYAWGGEGGIVIMSNTGWGVKEESGANLNHILGPTAHIHENVAGAVDFIGAESGSENVEQWATSVQAVSIIGIVTTMAGEVTTLLALAKKIYGIANANTEYEALVFDSNNRATEFRIVAYDSNDFGPGSGDTANEVERWLFEAAYNANGTIATLTAKEGL